MFLSKNLWTKWKKTSICKLTWKKKKSSHRTNHGKDYKKQPSAPMKKKNDTVKKLKKKNLWSKQLNSTHWLYMPHVGQFWRRIIWVRPTPTQATLSPSYLSSRLFEVCPRYFPWKATNIKKRFLSQNFLSTQKFPYAQNFLFQRPFFG